MLIFAASFSRQIHSISIYQERWVGSCLLSFPALHDDFLILRAQRYRWRSVVETVFLGVRKHRAAARAAGEDTATEVPDALPPVYASDEDVYAMSDEHLIEAVWLIHTTSLA